MRQMSRSRAWMVMSTLSTVSYQFPSSIYPFFFGSIMFHLGPSHNALAVPGHLKSASNLPGRHSQRSDHREGFTAFDCQVREQGPDDTLRSHLCPICSLKWCMYTLDSAYHCIEFLSE